MARDQSSARTAIAKKDRIVPAGDSKEGIFSKSQDTKLNNPPKRGGYLVKEIICYLFFINNIPCDNLKGLFSFGLTLIEIL